MGCPHRAPPPSCALGTLALTGGIAAAEPSRPTPRCPLRLRCCLRPDPFTMASEQSKADPAGTLSDLVGGGSSGSPVDVLAQNFGFTAPPPFNPLAAVSQLTPKNYRMPAAEQASPYALAPSSRRGRSPGSTVGRVCTQWPTRVWAGCRAANSARRCPAPRPHREPTFRPASCSSMSTPHSPRRPRSAAGADGSLRYVRADIVASVRGERRAHRGMPVLRIHPPPPRPMRSRRTQPGPAGARRAGSSRRSHLRQHPGPEWKRPGGTARHSRPLRLRARTWCSARTRFRRHPGGRGSGGDSQPQRVQPRLSGSGRTSHPPHRARARPRPVSGPTPKTPVPGGSRSCAACMRCTGRRAQGRLLGQQPPEELGDRRHRTTPPAG